VCVHTSGMCYVKLSV